MILLLHHLTLDILDHLNILLLHHHPPSINNHLMPHLHIQHTLGIDPLHRPQSKDS